MCINEFHFIDPEYDWTKSRDYTAMVRYRAKAMPCKIKFEKKLISLSATIEFEADVWAPADGQSLVVFDGQECIGGGIISKC